MIPIAKPLMEEEEKNIVCKVLSEGMLASGEYVTEFESRFSNYLGCRYAICTSNGTTALHAALLSAGIGQGELVITTPFSFIATANAILYVGAKPLFADIDEESFNINPDKIEEIICSSKEKVKALVIVHLFGNPCQMDRIVDICKKYDILLIEDCAQAHGAEYNGKKVGTFGKVSIFSFYPTKNITCGEGGIIVTNDEEIYFRAKRIINHGQEKQYNHTMLGYNYRMTNIAAAIGIEQLKKLNRFNAKRIENAKYYDNEVLKSKYILPETFENCKHVYNQYTLKCKYNREKLIGKLREENIGYGIYYPLTIPSQPLYKSLGIKADCPAAERMTDEVISIPVHPSLSQDDLVKIVSTLNEI